jgi:uncharacterized surface protein with fasciclin (FAS1) repeats
MFLMVTYLQVKLQTEVRISTINRRFISRGNDLYINGSKIILTDVKASNGTVHAIDKVMIARC